MRSELGYFARSLISGLNVSTATLIMPRSHLSVKPSRTDFCDMERDVAISWQLRGLRGAYWNVDLKMLML